MQPLALPAAVQARPAQAAALAQAPAAAQAVVAAAPLSLKAVSRPQGPAAASVSALPVDSKPAESSPKAPLLGRPAAQGRLGRAAAFQEKLTGAGVQGNAGPLRDFFDGAAQGRAPQTDAPAVPAQAPSLREAVKIVRAGDTSLAMFHRCGATTAKVYRLKDYPNIFAKHARSVRSFMWPLRRLALYGMARRLGFARVRVSDVDLVSINGRDPGRPGPIAPYAFLGNLTQLTMAADTRGVNNAQTRKLRDELNDLGILWLDGRPENVGFLELNGERRAVVIDMDYLFDFGALKLGWLVRLWKSVRNRLLFDATYYLMQAWTEFRFRMTGREYDKHD